MLYYNIFQICLWSVVLFHNLFGTSFFLISIAQWLLIGDIIMAVTKKINSNPIIVSIQVFSRIGVTMLSSDNVYFTPLSIVWALADLNRYIYYSYQNVFTKYLRYNLFWILYPLGMMLELVCLCFYSKYFLEYKEYYNAFFIVLYAIFGPVMYNHMVIANHKIYLTDLLENLDKTKTEKTNIQIHFGGKSFDLYVVNVENLKKKINMIGSFRYTTNGKITIKDLGLQVSWRGVFVTEYLGPLLIGLTNWNDDNKMLTMMWCLHYFKRILESIFVHKFSNDTMPVGNLFKNSLYYWGAAYIITSRTIDQTFEIGSIFLILIWIYAQVMNYRCHMYLSGLRDSSNAYGLPIWYPFRYVVCPNYSFEILGWLVFSILYQSPYALGFTIVGAFQMYVWGKKKQKRYKQLFEEKYRVGSIIIPGVL